MDNQQDAREGVTLDELDIMAERLGRCVPFGNYVDCHDVLGFAFTGLPPGPARDTALADLLARLGRPVDRQGDAPRILEAADCFTDPRGADFALTCEWPDGTETLEHVSTHAAALLGYRPDEEGNPLDAALSAQAGAAPGVGETVDLMLGSPCPVFPDDESLVPCGFQCSVVADTKVYETPEAAYAAGQALRARLASQPGGGPVAAGESDGELRKAVRAVVVAYDRDELAYKSPRLISALRAALGGSSGGEG